MALGVHTQGRSLHPRVGNGIRNGLAGKGEHPVLARFVNMVGNGVGPGLDLSSFLQRTVGVIAGQIPSGIAVRSIPQGNRGTRAGIDHGRFGPLLVELVLALDRLQLGVHRLQTGVAGNIAASGIGAVKLSLIDLCDIDHSGGGGAGIIHDHGIVGHSVALRPTAAVDLFIHTPAHNDIAVSFGGFRQVRVEIGGVDIAGGHAIKVIGANVPDDHAVLSLGVGGGLRVDHSGLHVFWVKNIGGVNGDILVGSHGGGGAVCPHLHDLDL